MSKFVILTEEERTLLEGIRKCFEGITSMPSIPDEDYFLYEEE